MNKKFYKKVPLFIISIFIALGLNTQSAFAATWVDQIGSGSRNWSAITSSADGTKLVAVVGGGDIYTSTNSGVTWTDQTAAGYRGWEGNTSSADGTKLAAISYRGDIYTSTDSGATWIDQTSAGSRNWNSITSSADGTKLVAVVGDGDIYTSADSGATWNDRTAAGSRNWNSITSSSDGKKLAAVASGGSDIYTSTNSGVTWTDQTSAGSRNWHGITSSSDGTKLVAVAYDDYIYTSTDGGATWTPQISSGVNYWNFVTSSSDGVKILTGGVDACGGFCGGGDIYTSTDSGVTWVDQTTLGKKAWQGVDSSADGTKLAVIFVNGDIYTYTSATTPLQPTAPTGTITTNTISLTWSAPSDGGSPITDYLIEYKPTVSNTWSSVSHTPSTTTSISIQGLTSGTSYDFRISAINTIGTGPSSTPLTLATALIHHSGAFAPLPPITITHTNPIQTNTSKLTLTIPSTDPNIKMMALSPTKDFTNIPQQSYTNTISYDICQGLTTCPPGTYTAYIRLYNSMGIATDTSVSITYKNNKTAITKKATSTPKKVIVIKKKVVKKKK